MMKILCDQHLPHTVIHPKRRRSIPRLDGVLQDSMFLFTG